MKIAKIHFVLLFVVSLASFNATAAVECAPQVQTLLTSDTTYSQLNSVLQPKIGSLKTKLDAVKNQATYATLLNEARTIATSFADGRLVVTLPDGTLVVDTSAVDDPTNTLPKGNSYLHFRNKTINENLNTRISNLDSQLHVCGIGVETRFSTIDLVKESFVAIRLGAYLNSSGTARISIKL